MCMYICVCMYYNRYHVNATPCPWQVGDSVVYFYWPNTKKVVLEMPLQIHTGKVMTGGMLRDADIKPELGVATYTIYPEVITDC